MSDQRLLTRSVKARILDIAIAASIGGLHGVFATGAILTMGLWDIRVTRIHATDLLIVGESGYVSINGSTGISMDRKDYAAAMLWCYEPGTNNSPTTDPTLKIIPVPKKSPEAPANP